MKVVIAHAGPLLETVIASSVNHGIKKQPVDVDITWVVKKEHKYIFKSNKDIYQVFSLGEFYDDEGDYDLFIQSP